MSTVLNNSPATKDAIREQWNKQAKGWNDSGAVIRPWLHGATQAMLAGDDIPFGRIHPFACRAAILKAR